MTDVAGRLAMELRTVNPEARTVLGVCCPYDETSYLTPHPGGERILRSAFNKSIAERDGNIFLCLEHEISRVVGRSVPGGFVDDPAEGLIGEFHIRKSAVGDQTLEELADGYWPYMSVGFRPDEGGQRRAADGVVEVTAAYLGHVALVHTAAYAGANVIGVRSAALDELLAGFGPRPHIDLSPLPDWRS